MKKLLILLLLIYLTGCQSNIIETTIKSSEIKDAINGEVQDIEFETNFSLMAELDETTKIELAKIESISSKYIDIEDFDVTEDDYFGITIDVEGEIPLLYSSNESIPSSVSTPWVLLISDNTDKGALSSFKYKLEFIASPTFNAFAGELQNVNMMIGLEQFQPVKFKLRNKDDSIFNIFTGSVEGSGESYATFESDVKDKVSLTMKGGIYDKTNQVIFFNID
jgi:hypothetical protein